MTYPLYRLHGNELMGWRVDVVLASVDFDCPHYDPDDSWTHTVKSQEIADVTTRESAEAVLRLVTAEYQDWTNPGGWDSPMRSTR